MMHNVRIAQIFNAVSTFQIYCHPFYHYQNSQNDKFRIPKRSIPNSHVDGPGFESKTSDRLPWLRCSVDHKVRREFQYLEF